MLSEFSASESDLTTQFSRGMEILGFVIGMKKLRLYLDTSVIGGCFDPEFAEESNLLIQQIKLGKYCAMISDMTFKELEGAPQQIRDLVKDLPIEHLIEVAVVPESIDLAEKYISEKVVPPWCQVDALHIATATFHNADLLLSWNFKHIVNVNRIMRYNSINLREGYKWL